MEQRGVLRIEIYGPPLFKNLIRHNEQRMKDNKEDKINNNSGIKWVNPASDNHIMEFFLLSLSHSRS